MDGIVKWFSKDKGYGFIHVPESADYFFHVSDVKGATLPNGGESVTFVPLTRADGKMAAKEVAILSQSHTDSDSHDTELAEIEKIMREEERDWPEYETSVTTEPNKNGVWVVLGFGVLGFYISKWLLESYFYIGLLTLMAIGLGGKIAELMVVRKTEYREITSTCLKCGGEGQIMASEYPFIGYRCRKCNHSWRKRKPR